MEPEIKLLDKCTSTNSLLLEKLNSGEAIPNFYTIYTMYQSSGYGQIGNKWESEDGKNLLFSTTLHPEGVKPSEQFFISEAIAIAVAESLDKYISEVVVKWPNDIYWRDKKIAGILIENNLSSATIKDCVIGVGLNVNQEVFYSDAPNPVSLYNITKKKFDIKTILEEIISNFKRLYSEGLSNRDALHTKYIERLYRYKKDACYLDAAGTFYGKISFVEADGHLNILDTNGNNRRYAFKEVSYII